MSRAFGRQTRFVAPFAEAVAESIPGERPPEFRDQKCQCARRRRFDNSLKLRVYRQTEGDRIALPILLLRKVEPFTPHMLASE